MLQAGTEYEVLELGHFMPKMQRVDALSSGEVGYLIANIKALEDVKIGDTVCHMRTDVAPLPGYREPLHMVYCGIYPTQNKDFEALRRALAKLRLNDASFSYTPETSDALGFGFRCGFLGLLHMEIVQERLERESGVDIVQTSPQRHLRSRNQRRPSHSPLQSRRTTRAQRDQRNSRADGFVAPW